MDNYRAIPPGFMTVGEVARKMDVTVRTLQHYDRIGLLVPSAISEGGRRLYTDKDIIRLHQILSLKRVGFSLEDIRDRLSALDTPEEVAHVLAEQATVLREQIRTLSDALADVEALRAEVLEIRRVDFRKYADILINLEMKNDFYWLIKHFDPETLDEIRARFDKDSAADFVRRFARLQNEAIRLHEAGESPESETALAFARAYWNLILEFTGGDTALLPKLMQLAKDESLGAEWTRRQVEASRFVEPALGAYFESTGRNPLEEEP